MVLRRIPAGYSRPPWIVLQHTFYALQSTGDLNRLDGALFSAIHEQHRRLYDQQSIADWVGANGGNSEGFGRLQLVRCPATRDCGSGPDGGFCD